MNWRLPDQGQGEGRARLVETDGQRAVVESTLPFAAGATLVGVEPQTGTQYRIKVRGGRRIDATWFRIEGRFVSLTRDERARLLATLGEKSSGEPNAGAPNAGEASPDGQVSGEKRSGGPQT